MPSSTISRDPKAKDVDMTLIAAMFIPDGDSRVRIASLKSGARPVFEDVVGSSLSTCGMAILSHNSTALLG